MPNPVNIECREQVRNMGSFSALYAALLLLSLHWAVVLYINSSYLEQFVSSQVVSGLYIVGAILTIVAFLYAPPLLTRFGNIRIAVALTILEIAALIGMAYLESVYAALILFIVHQAIVPLLLFHLDVLLEELIGSEESSTGGRRGLLLTIMSLTGALAALGMGTLIGSDEPQFTEAYVVSAAFLIPFLYILIRYFKNFKDPIYPSLRIIEGIQTFWHQRDLRNVFFAHFLLQLFFAWMVIYTPIYLFSVIGFNWEEIGRIMFVGLMAYVLLEYAIGFAADRYVGEKEMMAFGFAVIAIATSWFIFLDNTTILIWMIAMFMTRVGASFVETTTESYFFKHAQGKDTNIIGLFRITRPLSYVLGAALGAGTLALFKFEALFLILGLLMLPGLFFAMALKDTR